MGSGDTLILGGFKRGSAAPEHLKPFVPTGSVQSAKGEASDEDEETEYFDAMEDAPAFITVTADPKHHRYEPPPQDHALHSAIWRNLLQVQEEQGRDGLPGVMLGLEGSILSCRRLFCVHVPQQTGCLCPGLGTAPGCSCVPGASEAEDGPSYSEAGEEGQASSLCCGKAESSSPADEVGSRGAWTGTWREIPWSTGQKRGVPCLHLP